MINGGRLYDNWWKEIKGVKEPTGNHPLWKIQAVNKSQGSATWRCKECHGWDYRGKDGAYGTGSHYTGFPGILQADTMSFETIESILKGSTNPDHDFSNVLDDESISNLALFLKKGLMDLRKHRDYESKRPVKTANAGNGQRLYKQKCTKCHGEEGNKMAKVFDEEKENVGTVANENPWEFIHKVRFGEPRDIMPSIRMKLELSDNDEKRMPSGIETGYIVTDVMDILEFARSLPTN